MSHGDQIGSLDNRLRPFENARSEVVAAAAFDGRFSESGEQWKKDIVYKPSTETLDSHNWQK